MIAPAESPTDAVEPRRPRVVRRSRRVGLAIGSAIAALMVLACGRLFVVPLLEFADLLPPPQGDAVAVFTNDWTSIVKTVAFSPDGHTLAAGGVDCKKGPCSGIMGDIGPDTRASVRFWDVASHRQVGRPLDGHAASVTSVAYSPDRHLIASSDDHGDVWLWDASHQQTGVALPPAGWSWERNVVFSPDGRLLAIAASRQAPRSPLPSEPNTASAAVVLWDVARRQVVGELPGGSGPVFSPDGKTVATSYDPSLAGLAPGASSTPSGASAIRGVRLWDIASHQPTGDIASVTAASLAFSPDGRLLATAAGEHEDTVRLWDVASHQAVGPPLTGHRRGVYSVAFSPDGRLLATGDDGTIRFWDTATHQPVGPPLTGHVSQIFSITFSPDGRLLASGGLDGTARLWKVPHPR